MVTITTPHDVDLAVERGVDALCVQGIEAGAHRGGFTDDERDDGYGLLALIGAVREQTSLPLVATGGIMDGRDLAAVARRRRGGRTTRHCVLAEPGERSPRDVQGGPGRPRVHDDGDHACVQWPARDAAW